MRSAVGAIWALLFFGCAPAPATRGPSQAMEPPLNPSVEFLLTSAASDFRAHTSPPPVRFRSVRSGYVVVADGTKQYRLCGEFLQGEASDKEEWVPFVTVQTSGYEQSLGLKAVSDCESASMTWDSGDLSALLQSRLDALR